MSEYKMPLREQFSNKGTFGKVLNFAGSKNYIGAAYLSSVSVLKAGGGFVALSSEENIINSVSKLLPEAVYLSRSEGLKNMENYTVCLIGCGLGQSRYAKNLLKKVLELVKCPIVVDADGLNVLANEKNIILPHNAVITPHPLEAARLLGVELNEVMSDLESSAKKLSAKYNCVVVLKTHRTIICDKQNLFINQHGNSALAKAGTGDVLTGMISGLCAQGMTCFDAAKLGVYLHGRTGEIASGMLSEYSVLASDLLNYIPIAINEFLRPE